MHHDRAFASSRIHVVCRQDSPTFRFGVAKVCEQHICIRHIKIPPGEFTLTPPKHIAVRNPFAVVRKIEHILDLQHEHRKPFHAVGDLTGHRIALVATELLKIRELAHFHAVAPHFPAQTGGAERGTLPVVLNEPDIVLAGVDAD